MERAAWVPDASSCRAIAGHLAEHFGPGAVGDLRVVELGGPHPSALRRLEGPDGALHLSSAPGACTPVRCTFVSCAGALQTVTCPPSGSVVFRGQALWAATGHDPWGLLAVVATVRRPSTVAERAVISPRPRRATS